MTNHDKQLFQLLQASHRFLENPADQSNWQAFQKALQTVEAIEKAESLLAQPEVLKNPSQETNQILRRYYEEQLRPRNRALLWSTLLVVIFIGLTLYGVTRGLFTPSTLSGSTATLTLTLTLTSTATITSTSTMTATTTSTVTPVPSPTLTATVLPSPIVATATAIGVTPVVSPTAVLIPTITEIPMITSGEVTDTLTNDNQSRQHIFRGQSGDRVTIQLNSQDFDPYLSVLDQTGTEIVSNDDCGSLHRSCIGPIELPVDGVYQVIVESFSRRAVGSYTLKIQVIQSSPSTVVPNPTNSCVAALPRAIIETTATSVNLRNGPGQAYSIIGLVYNGECFEIIGRSTNKAWLKIRLTSGRPAWLSTSVAQLQGDFDLVPTATP